MVHRHRRSFFPNQDEWYSIVVSPPKKPLVIVSYLLPCLPIYPTSYNHHFVLIFLYTFYTHNTLTAIGADGSYYKFSFTIQGECHRDSVCKFLQMTDDWGSVRTHTLLLPPPSFHDHIMNVMSLVWWPLYCICTSYFTALYEILCVLFLILVQL